MINAKIESYAVMQEPSPDIPRHRPQTCGYAGTVPRHRTKLVNCSFRISCRVIRKKFRKGKITKYLYHLRELYKGQICKYLIIGHNLCSRLPIMRLFKVRFKICCSTNHTSKTML